jgi:hypothetical protein
MKRSLCAIAFLFAASGCFGGSVTVNGIQVRIDGGVTADALENGSGPSNDLAGATAHVADTNLHLRADERQRIAAALTNADEFAPAAHVADAAAHFTSGEKASVTGNVDSLMGWLSAFTMAHITVNGDSHSLLSSPSFTAATTNQGAKADSALQPASTNGWTVSAHQAWITEEADTNALAQLAAYKPIRLWSENNRFAVLEGGTNVVVYEINVVAYTNYTVTLSSDFEETVMHTRPSWTNNVFPFTDGAWSASGSGLESWQIIGPNGSLWFSPESSYVLSAFNAAIGSATINLDIIGTTNELFRIPLAAITNVVPETWTYVNHTNWMAVAGTNWVVQSVLEPWWFYARADYVTAEEYDFEWINHELVSGNQHRQYLLHTGGTSTNQFLVNPTVTGGNAATTGDVANIQAQLNAKASAASLVAATNAVTTDLLAVSRDFSGAIVPADGTATVSVATGSQPSLSIAAPTVIQLDTTGFPTTGVCRVSLNFFSGTNAVTFATNVVTYATVPAVGTSCWNTVLFRRAANCVWKGVGL